MKPKTRYTEEQLVDKIEDAKVRAKSLCERADDLDLKADALRGDVKRAHELVSMRTEAKKFRKKSARLIDSRIPTLSRALAVIRTSPLPGHAAFESVPLR